MRFAVAGYGVLAVGRNATALDELVGSVPDGAGRCSPFTADVTEPDAPGLIIEAAIGTYGRLDVLVNAAGVIGSGTIESTTDLQADAMMDVNLRAPFRLLRAAVPALEQTGGCVVNVSSVAGLRAFPGVLAYCVSKAALDQLTRCSALELAPKGVRVNAVNPGVVVSNLHRRSGMTEDAYEKFLEHSKATHPLGRTGDPAEVADLILFLATEGAAWITGATISIDGGRHLTCAR